MKIKNTVIMLVLAVALVAAAVYYGKKEQDYLGEASTPTRTLEPGVTSATVSRIEIQEPGKKLATLTRKEGAWLANAEKGFKADEGAVGSALGALEQPLVGEVVSSSPSSFDDYEVSESSGTRVKVFGQQGDKAAFDVVLGKAAGAAFTTYLRMAGEEDVLRLNSNMGMVFKREDGWRDRQMLTFDSTSANRIEAAGTSGTFTLSKKDGKWSLESPVAAEAQEAKANGIANMLASLRASDFPDESSTATLADLGLEPAQQAVSVQYEDKVTSPAKASSVTLLLGNQVETGTDFYAVLAGKNEVFTVGAYVAQELLPEISTLKVEPPPAPVEDAGTTGTAEVEPEEGDTTGATTMAVDVATTDAEVVATPAETPAPEVTPVPNAVPTPEVTPAPSPKPTPEPVTAPVVSGESTGTVISVGDAVTSTAE